MSNNNVCLVGYHGTCNLLRKKIEKYGFKKSKGGWLGGGIYFFEDSFEMATNWAKRKYKSDQVCFIKRIIEVEESKFFDISWPLDSRTKYFFKEREKFIEVAMKKGYNVYADDKQRFEGGIIDSICREKKYDVVRACTYTYQKIDDKCGLDSIFSNTVEVCVKNEECMKVS